MQNNTRKTNFYTQGQRLAARVSLIVWLLASCGPESALAWGSRIPGPLTIVKGVLGAAAILWQPGSSLDFQQTCPSNGLHSCLSNDRSQLQEMKPLDLSGAPIETDADMPKIFGTDISEDHITAMSFNVTTSCQRPLEAAGAGTFWKEIQSFLLHHTDDAFLRFYFNQENITDKDTQHQNALAQQLISCLRGLGLPIGTLEIIEGKNLTDVGKEMKYLNVTNLFLTNTALPAIPDLCEGHIGKTLRVLNLYGNKLNDTSDFRNLECLTALITLDLRSNLFTRLPDSLPSLRKLENLSLSGNPLKDTSELSMLTNATFPALTTLRLSGTNLTNLPEPVTDILPQLKALYLINTPACASRFNSIKASAWNVSDANAQKIKC